MGEESPKTIEDLLVDIANSSSSTPKSFDFTTPKEAREDATKIDPQTAKHREILIWLVVGLSVASFLLLCIVILFQMWKRLSYPHYTGVSDNVIKVLSVSVFGQVIAVVGSIAIQVWRKR